MKLLCSLLFLSGSMFYIYAQEIPSDSCSLDNHSYKVRIRDHVLEGQRDLKFSARDLKQSEICLVLSLQGHNDTVVYILDARHEVVIYPLIQFNID